MSKIQLRKYIKKKNKSKNSLKECLIVFTNYFTAWPLAHPMAIEGMNLVVAGGIQRLLVHRCCTIHLGPSARSYRIQNACDSSVNERRIRKKIKHKHGEIRIQKRTSLRSTEKRETVVLPFNPEFDFATLEFWWDSGVSEGSDFHDGRLSPGGKPA